jgi:large conductance mechanosensitive channel
LAWGSFLTIVLNFLVVAWVLFLVVKGVNRLHISQPAAPAELPKDVQLLTEIRDLLKNRSPRRDAQPS